MAATLPRRSEVPVEKTWDAESIFATQEDWQKAVEDVNQRASELNKHAGKLANSSRTLLEALQERDNLFVKAGHIYQWAMMHQVVDSDNQEAIGRLGQAQMLYARVQAAAAFIEPEIREIEPQKLDALMSEKRARTSSLGRATSGSTSAARTAKCARRRGTPCRTRTSPTRTPPRLPSTRR